MSTSSATRQDEDRRQGRTASTTAKCAAICQETWDLAGSPHVVTCDVTVAAGCALTVDAGVVVRFQSDLGLHVSGVLDVNGTSGSMLSVTSDAAGPSAGDWHGFVG